MSISPYEAQHHPSVVTVFGERPDLIVALGEAVTSTKSLEDPTIVTEFIEDFLRAVPKMKPGVFAEFPMMALFEPQFTYTMESCSIVVYFKRWADNPREVKEGEEGVVHGGVTTMFCDTAAGHFLHFTGNENTTRKLACKFFSAAVTPGWAKFVSEVGPPDPQHPDWINMKVWVFQNDQKVGLYEGIWQPPNE